eukprot:UC1_evm1s862
MAPTAMLTTLLRQTAGAQLRATTARTLHRRAPAASPVLVDKQPLILRWRRQRPETLPSNRFFVSVVQAQSNVVGGRAAAARMEGTLAPAAEIKEATSQLGGQMRAWWL